MRMVGSSKACERGNSEGMTGFVKRALRTVTTEIRKSRTGVLRDWRGRRAPRRYLLFVSRSTRIVCRLSMCTESTMQHEQVAFV
jgi:hypothetical protein